MIEVKDLVKQYDNHLALDHLSFQVEDCEIFGFLGPNGAGKSTAMNIMTGYLAPTDGTVMIDGFDIQKSPMEVKRRIGYLPEIPPVYPDMTPFEYLRFVGQAKEIPRTELKAEICRVMEMTSITAVQHQMIKTLSKGYRQRVGLAQAIMGDPRVIILDEPTVGLDPVQIIEFREMVKKLGKRHTVILSSHLLAEVSEICHKVMIIVKGRLVAVDTPENLAGMLGRDITEVSLEDIFLNVLEKEEKHGDHAETGHHV